MAEFVEANKEWLGKLFKAFEPWKSNTSLKNWLAWLRFTGVPLNAWNEDGIRKTLARFGTLISMVDEIKEMANLQYARALVRTLTIKPIHEF